MRATTTYDATRFLYDGSAAVQEGVAPGTIVAKRAAVVRGKVTNSDGSALVGVLVFVPVHPEYGSTITRSDGWFDLAVNGGDTLDVRFELSGRIPAHRQVTVDWQEFALVQDVALPLPDGPVTVIDTGGPLVQPAAGAVSHEEDTSHQVVAAFAPGTVAHFTAEDGSDHDVQQLDVRVTEIPVDRDSALPGPLPTGAIGLTAADFQVEEAQAQGASGVTFNHPVPVYVENYRGLPVGLAPDVFHWDKEGGGWQRDSGAKVVGLVGVSDGVALVDADGDGLADSDEALAALGIDATERSFLAQRYAPGQSLVRMETGHFSMLLIALTSVSALIDLGISTQWVVLKLWWYENYGIVLPNLPSIWGAALGFYDDDPCKRSGSIISCESQILGESVPVEGTPFSLFYSSDRTPGRDDAYSIHVPLLNDVPPGLIDVTAELEVAGQVQRVSLTPSQGLDYVFHWDGHDGYGRLVQGAQPATVRVIYQSDAPGGPITSVTQETKGYLGSVDMRGAALGGWSLSAHHTYDPATRTLFRGDGTRKGILSVPEIMETIAGTGAMVPSGNGGAAKLAALGRVDDVEVGPDGAIYTLENWCTAPEEPCQPDNRRGAIRRVLANGTIETLREGQGLYYTRDIELSPRGELMDLSCFPETFGERCLIRVSKASGYDVTLAGASTNPGTSDDNVPPRSARLLANDMEVMTDGAILVADAIGLRRIEPAGGNIRTLSPKSYSTIAAGPRGTAYAVLRRQYNNGGDAEGYAEIYRVYPTGFVELIAGRDDGGALDDGVDAHETWLGGVGSLETAPDGSLLVLSRTGDLTRIRRIGLDGKVYTVAGAREGGTSIDENGLPAMGTRLAGVTHFALTPEGEFIAADRTHRLRQLRNPSPKYSGDSIFVPDDDGLVLHEFSSSGRHIRTRSTVLGRDLVSFEYDAGGRLASVTDVDGRKTLIERDGGGNPLAIVAPDTWRTTLEVNEHGWLESIATPSTGAFTMTYQANGLLSSFATPGAGANTFSYDLDGRLVRDDDPFGGYQQLDRTVNGDTETVVATTRSGLTTSYTKVRHPDGSSERRQTDAVGRTRVVRLLSDTKREVVEPDGTRATYDSIPDSRFGMLEPVPHHVVLERSDGVKTTIDMSRQVTLSDPADPLSLTSLLETTTRDGHSSSVLLDVPSRSITMTSPAGRVTTQSFDDHGRISESFVPGYVPFEYAYDPAGRLTSVSRGQGDAMRSITATYDERGLARTVDAPGQASTSYEYDETGRLTAAIQADGHRLDLGASDDRLRSTMQTSRGTYSVQMDLATRSLQSSIPEAPGAGHAARVEFDYDGRLARAEGLGGELVVPEYDTHGLLAAITTPRGRTTFGYDSLGRVTSALSPEGESVETIYRDDQPRGIRWVGTVNGAVEMVPDSAGRVGSEMVNGASAVDVAYDDDGLPVRIGPVTLVRDPDNGTLRGETIEPFRSTLAETPFGEMSELSTSWAGTELLGESILTRDASGRILRRQERGRGVPVTFDYSYDALGRLIEVERDGISSSTYTYDEHGSRSSRTTPSESAAAAYDAQGRLTGWGSVELDYTLAGEIAARRDVNSGASMQYRYVDGALASVDLPGGTRLDYVLDASGLRIGRKRNGQIERGWLYDGNRLVAELDGMGNLESRFIYALHGHVPTVMVRGGVTYAFVRDRLGSVRMVVRADSGAVVQELEYDEFGRRILDTNPGFQPFGFAGGMTDLDTSLVHFGARDYDPELGRWLTRDPTGFAGGDVDVYAYVANDPVNWIDPLGTTWWNPASWTADDVMNFSAGFGDTISFGLTKKIRGLVGVDDVVDPCSKAYAAGAIASVAVQLAPVAVSLVNRVRGMIGAGEELAGELAEACRGAECLGTNCFAAGTPVETPDGPRPIETLEVGSVVLAADPQSGKQSWKPIERVYVSPGSQLLRLHLVSSETDGRLESTLEMTPEHPVRAASGVWVPAGQLEVGDAVMTASGSAIVVGLETLDGTHTVYNIGVKDEHTYYAGAAGVWVHNAGSCVRIGPKWRARDIAEAVCEKGCERVAQQIQKQIGGDIIRIMPPEDANWLGKFRGTNWRWTYHEVVVKDGLVYGLTTGHEGIPAADYKGLLEYAEGINFGF